MKWVKRIILAVVVLVVIAVGVLYFSLNSIVRKEVQQQATASLNVPTTLGSAHLALFGGTVSLNDLQVGSPPKFTAPRMFTLNGVNVAVSYGQLTGNPIRIKQIVITDPKLVIEQQNLKLNIQALMDQLPTTPTGTGGQPKEPMKLIIDELDVNNAKVDFMPGFPGMSDPIEIPVPTMSLKNIGNADGNQNGAAIKDVVMQVVTALAGKASEGGKLPIDVNKMLATGLGQVSQKLGGEFDKQFQGMTGNLGKNLPAGVSNLLTGASTQGSKIIQQNIDNVLGGLGKKKNGQ